LSTKIHDLKLGTVVLWAALMEIFQEKEISDRAHNEIMAPSIF
jgi:hypothetical protein